MTKTTKSTKQVQNQSVIDFDKKSIEYLRPILSKYDFTITLKYLYSYSKETHNPALTNCMSNLLRQMYMESKYDNIEDSVLNFDKEIIQTISEELKEYDFMDVLKYLYTIGYEIHNPALVVGTRNTLKKLSMEKLSTNKKTKIENGEEVEDVEEKKNKKLKERLKSQREQKRKSRSELKTLKGKITKKEE
tara:strand:+ start:737 stop:1306 length:570 start_codon:yes stop_codon:yes gene_type:complete